MTKFNNKYRIESTRLKNWNYARKGLYFVTINTKNFKSLFGDIKDGQMHYSEIGLEVQRQWLTTAELRSDMNLILDEFQVMPNHFHAIIGIGRNKFNVFENQKFTSYEIQNLGITDMKYHNSFGPQSKNLGSIIRGFKSAVTSFAKSNNLDFGWHPRYHDIIIRDEKCLDNVRRYIRNSVKNWDQDRLKKDKRRKFF